MTTIRFITTVAALTIMTAPAIALAQSDEVEPRLLASAFNDNGGATVRFLENPSDLEAAAPRIREMRIGRPARVSVSTPPAGRTLGTLTYEIGPRTLPADELRRKITLRRRVALGGGRYSLASAGGARVVLSTRSRSAFVTATLPSRARYVTIRFTGAGARLFDVRGACTSQRFTARFAPVNGSVVRTSSAISSSNLRKTKLC
ncbi:MAG: hypothetical protein WKF96_10090 [Solirubrobacteraceae bacterium]